MTTDLTPLAPWIDEQTMVALREAVAYSSGVVKDASWVVNDFIAARGLDASSISVTVVGSVGRMEALGASDVDLLPLWMGSKSEFAAFKECMDELRGELANRLNLDVAGGRSVLATRWLDDLADPKCIGGDQDKRDLLTARVLLLTEAQHLGGGVGLDTVRRRLLDAYAGEKGAERSAGRHPMAVCNDIARYYRTVCVDYKSAAESKPESWCLRNVKLRHARKFWYFASMLPIAAIGVSIPTRERDGFVRALLRVLELPPVLRVFKVEGSPSDPDLLRALGKVVDRYAWYLKRMADPETRAALGAIAFEDREGASEGASHYSPIHEESKRMHDEMRCALDLLPPVTRGKLVDWFLL